MDKYTWRPASHHSHSAAGFTILELLISMTVFAAVMLVLAVGVVSLTHEYYKGITSTKTQTAARSVMSQLAEAIQFGKTVTIIPANASGVAGYCIDNTLYTYKIGQQVTDNPVKHGLILSSSASCASASPASLNLNQNGRELLGRSMRLGALDISQTGDRTYAIHVRVIYGDDDLLAPAITGTMTLSKWAGESCTGNTGFQFCAVSDLTTTVEQRLTNVD